MREYDERVLLHEVLHVLCRNNRALIEKALSVSDNGEEGLVQAFTAGLFGMGWRWRVRDRSASAAERDDFRARDEITKTRERAEKAEAGLSVAHEALRDALDCKGSFRGTVSERGGDPALCTKCEASARAVLAGREGETDA